MASNKRKLLELIDIWFYSDLEIECELKYKGSKDRALCFFESDVWYEHINNSRGVTVKSIRHNGNRRRLVAVESGDDLWEYLRQYCYRLYAIDELNEVVEELAHNCRIYWSD
ncbi:hypothetical protein KEJ15_06840 [Candidatus Bathyarchaeota archaeon]|nr:hypothetical protein [Candidatus Bathyarchaeota archaeon]